MMKKLGNEDLEPTGERLESGGEAMAVAGQPPTNATKYGAERDNHRKLKADYVHRLEAMTDKELYDAAEQMIWLSAYANNNPRSDYHWQADATYDEAQRRGKPEIYQRAHAHDARSVS